MSATGYGAEPAARPTSAWDCLSRFVTTLIVTGQPLAGASRRKSVTASAAWICDVQPGIINVVGEIVGGGLGLDPERGGDELGVDRC